MKRLRIFFLALALVFSSLPAVTVYADSYKDTPMDQAGDWFATLGKEGFEKDKILFQRKAERIAKYAQRQAEEAAKEVQKTGKDLKKKMGF